MKTHKSTVPRKSGVRDFFYLNFRAFGNVNNEVNVRVVVVIRSTWHRHVLVSHSNVLGVRSQVFWCDHDDEAYGMFVLEHFVRPASHRAHTLHSRNAIVRNEHLQNNGAIINMVLTKMVEPQVNAILSPC